MSYIEVKWCKEENQENKYSKKKNIEIQENFIKTSVIQKIFFIFFSYFGDKSMKFV